MSSHCWQNEEHTHGHRDRHTHQISQHHHVAEGDNVILGEWSHFPEPIHHCLTNSPPHRPHVHLGHLFSRIRVLIFSRVIQAGPQHPTLDALRENQKNESREATLPLASMLLCNVYYHVCAIPSYQRVNPCFKSLCAHNAFDGKAVGRNRRISEISWLKDLTSSLRP